MRVPRLHEAVAALLHPTCEIARRDPIGPGEDRTIGFEQRHLRTFIHHLLRIGAQAERIRSVVLIEILQVVLHDQHAAVLHVLQQATVGGLQFRTYRVGARAQDDRVVSPRDRPASHRSPPACGRLWLEIVERLRNIVAGAGQIGDAQPGRGLHVHAHRAIHGRAIERIWPQAGDIPPGGNPLRNSCPGTQPRP